MVRIAKYLLDWGSVVLAHGHMVWLGDGNVLLRLDWDWDLIVARDKVS